MKLGLLFALILAAIPTGCGYATHKDPQLYYFKSHAEAEAASKKYATQVSGWFTQINCCGSMRPLIEDGDWIVVVMEAYDDNLLGRVVSYHAKWPNDGEGGNVVHRLVAGSAEDGFIPSGDNNRFSEPYEPVRMGNYRGTVVVINRVVP